uniref:acyltransferase family protein n=1 Tax=uncultured Micrococcus sp. TaxID=114051 RepID=UPI002637547D|nr:acyltransferase family protein [uncultured Micrococcus sp.]
MPRPVASNSAYFPGLDGLRALAVLLVVAYHLGVPHASGGLLGVGVFFTLSGFLITALLLRRHERHGELDLKDFWIRRFRRLLPAVVLVLIAVLAATALVEPGEWDERVGESLAALFYVANWHTILTGGSYFEQMDGPGPLDHLWSLAVEEQFYLVWPLLLLGLLALTRGLGGRRRTVVLFVVVVLLGTASMVLLALLADPLGDTTRAYEGTDTRAGGLLWGAALALLWRPASVGRVRGAAVWALDLVGVLGLAGILALVATTDQDSPSLYTWGIAALTVATCAAVLPLVHPASRLGRVLGVAPLRWIGARSYGIYLWHMPVVAFLPDRALYGQPVLRGALILGLTLLIAALSWRFVEDPIRHHGLRAVLTGRAPARRSGAEGATTSGASARSRGSRGVRSGLAAAAVAVLAAAGLAGLTALPQTSTREIVAQAGHADPAVQDADPAQGASTPPGEGPGSPVTAPASAASPSAAASSAPAPATTSCTEVVHIGDSSSLASGNTDATVIKDPALRITAQYEDVGVEEVVEDIRPGRGIVERFEKDPGQTNAVQAITAHLPGLDPDGCFVVNVGMNDAALFTKVDMWDQREPRIDMVMKAAQGRRVLWVDVMLMPWAALPNYTMEGAARFNEGLVAATERHPNLWVYDWAHDAADRPEWFGEKDSLHNTVAGAVAKAANMAEALTLAFPAGREPSMERVIVVG